MLLENLQIFSKKNEIYGQKLKQFKKLQVFNDSDEEKIFDILCEFFMNPKYTDDVCDCFPQLIPALICASISTGRINSHDGDIAHKLNCVILGKLVQRDNNLPIFAQLYFDANPAPFDSTETDYSPLKKRNKRRISLAEVSEYDLVSATYDILCSAPVHFRYKWNWSKFYKYLTSEDTAIKWIALNCIAIVLGMSESCHLSCADNIVANYQQFLTQYKDNTSTTIVPAKTEKSDQISKEFPSVVSIGGILLPVFKKRKLNNVANLIPVPSTRRNLQNLALAVSSNKCVCLQGAVGSGKTTLVEFLAQATGRGTEDFGKVQLGDQTDSKMLLGMYRCTDIPGEFLWQPGILTEAVLNGKWLLLEDIDCASTDVASVIGHLIETKTLSVPGYRDSIRAKSGFQLFVTRRLASGGTQKSLQVAASLRQHWTCVNVEPLSKDELVTVVQRVFPSLNTVATRIVDVFLLFSVGNHEDDSTNYTKNGRQTSTRDLMKWCSRAVVDFDVSSPDSALKIFQDALDVFCYSVPDCGQRLNLAIAVAHKLGIIKTKAEYFCQVYKPVINVSQEILSLGRAKLQRKKSQLVKMQAKKINFSYTRPSVCLLERIATCVAQKEPVLLVGETGTGKTSCVQYLAEMTGHKLIVINMNQQSESADLLGGYKPVDLKILISPIREEFEILFRSYFAIEPNKKFLTHLGRCFEERKWKTLANLMIHSSSAALKRLRDTPESQTELETLKKWELMAQKLNKLQTQVKSQFSLAFSFVEGSLIKALRNGDWVLLDEINLATAETLECLSGLLEDSCGSLSLLERGDKEPVKRHPDFAVFACMNPATDVGKKDLPTGLRNRFTEFFVDELTEKSDLHLLISSYLNDLNLPPERLDNIVKFYLNVRKEANNSLLDGTGHKPHYSLRTLCRALSVSAKNPCENIQRSLYEAFSLSFLTQLDRVSYPIVQRMIVKAILNDKTAKGVLGGAIPRLRGCDPEDLVSFEGYWILKGNLEPQIPENYILTETVKRNLKDLVRVVSIGKMPVLLQGDTSVGKTSLITFLAKASGHICVRINNHEHTDLQEYVGTYVADSNGKLIFKEGILVDAMRKGYWIILDELNLAPSDVLEALNRVLDDNRELFIPETQQVVKAHEKFMLFATQNPPGLYGGRKVLSRAFRNRFVELHFDEIPAQELQIILEKRCKMPTSYCKQVINVMTELQVRRKSTATFAGKKGFITLRDLFRWAERYHLAPDKGTNLYDWSQHLADEGYLVLSSKVRHVEECSEIIQVLKKHLRRDVDPEALFSLSEKTSTVTRPILESLLSKRIPGFEHVVWTFPMRKMAVLLSKACDFKEPVLLIGETGGGKTTVCQLLAAIKNQELSVVNCHMHTEASDFLGSLRPVREHKENQKLFEWVDGPLVLSMKNGGFFLADEISLADDSVLERLNSLLEPERKLLVAEKSSDEEDSTVVAEENFIFVGTMNPGGDYGKKELSPALRNRFTEVWCEGCVTEDDLRRIMVHNLREEYKSNVSTAILKFFEWLKTTEIGKKLVISVRDVLTWVNFVNCCDKLEIGDAFYHGACLSFIDGLGSGLTASENSVKLKAFKTSSLKFIELQVQNTLNSKLILRCEESDIEDLENRFGISPFYVEKGIEKNAGNIEFAFASPTTRMNTLKLLRALQLKKPILLEGSPGVGKTSLVSALAKASRHPLLRLNLSDQTDISDLFGADLPIEGGKPGEFAWRDGPFLRALKNGHWILLDELNLASQSVLEGLNACLDHRGEVYVPELGKTFFVKPGTRLFGSQNPLRQGGARRGLPKSFLNRFTQVFIDALEVNDLKYILRTQFPEIPNDLLDKMIVFNEELNSQVGIAWAHSGSPWEMNLRDVTRWCQSIISKSRNDLIGYLDAGNGAELNYVCRMRTEEDKERVRSIYREIFPVENYPLPDLEFPILLTKEKLYLGNEVLNRGHSTSFEEDDLLLLREQKTTLKALAQCINMNWMAILVGGSGCGKSSLVRLLANLAGRKLKSIVVNSAMDTTEILGGFEQTDYNRHLEELLERIETLLFEILRCNLRKENVEQIADYHGLLEKIRHLSEEDKSTKATMSSETKLFLRKIQESLKLVSFMKTLETSREFELQEIHGKLTDLSIIVENDKCLNAGGKFEWVDSILVKCLQNGTWLLLDQVNLCSPAILDRLNGLLEPNGALTIGEKGVDADGNVFTVKPHENFRLFLTMDPRYGEISRAMRNRGVEISILTPKEIRDYNRIDLKSLLNNCGIEETKHQNLLLKLHESLSADKFGLIELLQVASFTRQQISKGFPFEESLRNSCREIYVAFDSKSKKEALRKIDEILAENFDGGNSVFFSLHAITPRICDLRRNARLANIRQQGFLLKSTIQSVRNMKQSRLINFEDLFDETSPVTSGEELTKHLLLDFYERSSFDDLEMRRSWCSSIFSEFKLENFGTFCDILGKEIRKFETLLSNGSSAELPLNFNKNPTAYNSMAIALYFHLMILEKVSQKNIPRKEVMSLEEYSSAVCCGKISSNLKNEPLITNFLKLIEHSRAAIDAIVHDEKFAIDEISLVELRDDLKWYKRFEKLGKIQLIDKSRGTFFDLREITSTLKVHYKWLLKFFTRLCDRFDTKFCNSRTMVELENFSKISSEISIDVDRFKKVRKRVKKSLHIPTPHFNEESMNFYGKLGKLSRRYEVNEEDLTEVLKIRLKIVFLAAADNLGVREKLIDFFHQVFTDNSINSERIENLREIEETAGKIADIKDICAKSLEISNNLEEIEIWPIYEFFFVFFVCRLQGKISENIENLSVEMNTNSDETICTTLIGNPCETNNDGFAKIFNESILKKFEKISTISPRLMSLVKVLNGGDILKKHQIPLLQNLFYSLEEFSQRSFAAKNSQILLNWNNLRAEENEENSLDFSSENFISKSTLLNLIVQLLLPECANKKDRITIGNYKQQKKQLTSLQNLLWKNSLILNSSKFDFTTNDSILLQFYINYYLLPIENVKNFPLDKLTTDEKEDLQKRFFEPAKILRKIEENSNIKNNAMERGKAWLILGHLQIFLFSDLGAIDPVQKIALKSKYLRENIFDLENSVYVEKLQSQVLGISLKNTRFTSKMDHLNKLKEESKDLENFQAVRPSSTFQALREEIENFSKNIGSFETIYRQIDRLNDLAEEIKNGKFVDFEKNERIREASVWQKSIQRFSEKLERKFLDGFPDLVFPLIFAVSSIRHGISILIEEIANLRAQNEGADVFFNLIRFPTMGVNQENYGKFVSLCSSEKTVFLLGKYSKSRSIQKDRLELAKIALKELENISFFGGKFSQSLWNEMSQIFRKIRHLWREQEEEREEKLREEESLFKTKFETKEEEEFDFQKMFPSFQQDFLELKEAFPDFQQHFQELQNIPESVPTQENSFLELISLNDAKEFKNIHLNILKNCKSSQKNGKNITKGINDISEDSTPNFVDSLTKRFELIKPSLKIWPENFSARLTTSLNVLIWKKLNFDNKKTESTSYDFYKDPNITEIEDCLPSLRELTTRINTFLENWPENPILSSINSVIDRILAFSINSPLSRFLVGIELLSSKLQQWEENAYHDVSLAEFIQFFGGKILHWRKIEISRWRDSLEVVEEDLKTEASKWWFFLFDLVDQFLQAEEIVTKDPEELENVEESENRAELMNKDLEEMANKSENDGITKEKVIESLERFLSESSLIEFQPRLQLISLFYQHTDHLEETPRKKELSAIFWNIYNYYNQFLNDVEVKIKSLKEPIGRKLKDTIKITRWNDISYWSVKNTAEKARRTLHKLVKEFQKALRGNVSSYLTIKPRIETVEKSFRRELGSSDFLIDFQSEELKKMDKFTKKARIFCEDIVSNSNYPKIRNELECFVEEMLFESRKLRDLETEKNLTKNKRDSQAKSILQRKKLALANYFKTLAHIGISYRLGILTWKNRKDEVVDFASSPVDLLEIQRYDFSYVGSNIEKGLLEQWSGCDKYYYGSLVKLNTLNAILSTTKNDLGLQNAERCRGFSIHLVLMAHRQKKTIANFFKRFLPLKMQVSNFILMLNDSKKTETLKQNNVEDIEEVSKQTSSQRDEEIFRQRDLQDAARNFRELLTILEVSLRQIVIFLNSSPEEAVVDDIIDLNDFKVPILQDNGVAKNSAAVIKDSLNVIKSITAKAHSWISVFEKIQDSGQILLLHGRHFSFLRSSYEEVRKIKDKLLDLRSSFTLDHPISENLSFLIDKIDDNLEFFGSISTAGAVASEKSDRIAEFERKLDSLVTKVLLVVQEKFRESDKSNEEAEDPENEEIENEFEENTFTDRLVGSLKKDVSDVRLKIVSTILGELMQIICELDAESANHCTRLLLQKSPLLEQYVLLLHYFLHEQVASFRLTCKFLYLQLSVFLELAANGFCQPKDADSPEQGEESGEAEGGMGLADGEGSKDVSDRIESEDQLEEAKRPDEEKKNEKKDTKEEENGIEMSEDFDSHLQDLERGEEEEKQEEDDEDMDKEMGETEEGAEKLDEEMWRDEDEEEDEGDGEQNEENKKEERGKGEEIGNDELTAKDDNDDGKNDKEGEEGEDKQRKDEERKEINEFEEPEMNDDQIDPYHGKHQPEIEPEPFDLPEDVDLDDDMNEENSQEEKNPFDIDEMKESKMPEEKVDEEKEPENVEEEKDAQQDSSDEEGDEENLNKENKKEKATDDDKQEEDTPEEESKEEEKENEGEKAQPSNDEGSKEVDASEEVNSRKDGSRDAVEGQSNEENEETDPTEKNADDKKDKGTGQAQTEERTGHSGATKEENLPSSGREKDSKPMERRRKPGQSDENRSLLDDEVEPRAKKLKTAPLQEELTGQEDEKKNPEEGGESEIYEHIKSTEKFDNLALDAATEEQVKKQASNVEQDENEEMDENPDDDIEMHDDEAKEEEEQEETKKKQSEKMLEKKKENVTKSGTEGSMETEEIDITGEVEGETVETTRILRGNETTFHTKFSEIENINLTVDQIEQRRFEIEKMLSEYSREPSSSEAATAWNSISALTEISARELAEKLRLVLEPTLTSRLKGDYRTGRRINMKKIIPYIASEFRKDKIWLRRTKPSKRDYQVVLAIDDSSSMADNHSKELAFESLSLIGKAMTYLEVGQLAVVNFGERVNILHPLGENFTEESGAKLIQDMKFEQKKTMIGELLDFTTEMFESYGSASDNAKLVAILSDGRGIFSEGTEKVSAAVRRAKLANIFLVFIIVDNPLNKDSILDIRMPVFENGKLLGIRSYMDNFPFPFYIILRDLNTLPIVLSDALRQWFEIVGRIDT